MQFTTEDIEHVFLKSDDYLQIRTNFFFSTDERVNEIKRCCSIRTHLNTLLTISITRRKKKERNKEYSLRRIKYNKLNKTCAKPQRNTFAFIQITNSYSEEPRRRFFKRAQCTQFLEAAASSFFSAIQLLKLIPLLLCLSCRLILISFDAPPRACLRRINKLSSFHSACPLCTRLIVARGNSFIAAESHCHSPVTERCK